MKPSDPISAVTSRDPYPYYAQLRSGAPLFKHPRLNWWVASRASAVHEVLHHPSCRVRPVAEPVPRGIAGGAGGEVFAELVRMNDGAAHDAGKRALEQGLRGLAHDRAQALAARHAQALGERHGLDNPNCWTPWAFDVPVHCLADLLGWPAASRDELRRQVRDFVACLSPLSTAEQLVSASEAAQHLRHTTGALVEARATARSELVQRIDASGHWHGRAALVANLIGLFSQTFEASAGLIGNTLAALLQRPALREQLRAAPALVPALVREVSRFDPSVQNTRRFVAEPAHVCGVDLAPGDTILVVLAAASRDPALHVEADALRIERDNASVIGFGAGTHACPGQALACAIASGAVSHFVQRGVWPARPVRWTYRPSVNARIPLFRATALPHVNVSTG